jgi:hypothetical protein
VATVSFFIVVGVFAAALFLASFLTKRRVGLLGLALAAGYVLAQLWTQDLTPLVANAGIEVIKPPLSSLVATILTLLPAVFVFFHGATTKGKLIRIAHALVFAGLGVALLMEPIGAALVIDDTAKPVYDFLKQYNMIFITAGIALSVVDLMMGKIRRREREPRH